MIAHIGGIFFSFVAPLVVWLVQKDKGMSFVEDQAKEALNFQITVAIALIASSILGFIGIGFILYPLVVIANLVLCIMAGMKANEGVEYRYPFALRLVK